MAACGVRYADASRAHRKPWHGVFFVRQTGVGQAGGACEPRNAQASSPRRRPSQARFEEGLPLPFRDARMIVCRISRLRDLFHCQPLAPCDRNIADVSVER
jgi:hypothetical protein